MRYYEIFEGKETLELPDIEIGDEVLVGKFKNRKAVVKGFTKDEHNQPVLKTNKGDQKLFKPRISKLEEENLNELKLPSGRSEAGMLLRKAGYNLLGNGSFASVFKKNGANYVLKIFDVEDHSFVRYVELAKQHSDNPHFPKYKGKLIKITNDYYAIRMEELSEISVYSDHEISIIHNLADYTRSCVVDRNSIETRNPSLYEFMNKPNNKKLKEAAELIAGITHDVGDIDISRINVMTRAGILVIIDPLYSRPR